jgi:hypothetical protein
VSLTLGDGVLYTNAAPAGFGISRSWVQNDFCTARDQAGIRCVPKHCGSDIGISAKPSTNFSGRWKRQIVLALAVPSRKAHRAPFRFCLLLMVRRVQPVTKTFWRINEPSVILITGWHLVAKMDAYPATCKPSLVNPCGG